MTKLPKLNPTHTVTVLSISPIEGDHIALNNIFNRSDWPNHTDSKWVLLSMPSESGADPSWPLR
jgi:hypothetical protein